MSPARSRWRRRALVALLGAALLGTVAFANRAVHSWLLLRTAYQVDAPDLSHLRPWMTLRYVAHLYGTPLDDLERHLGLPADIGAATTLKTLALQHQQTPFDYLRAVQLAIAELQPQAALLHGHAKPSHWGALGDDLLAAVLHYGYPALGLALMLGSVGMPLPSGLLVVVAGSLVAQHRMGWAAAGSVVVAATLLGDAAGYGLGRLLTLEVLERRGRWIGYTPVRRQRVERLFQRWGLASVLVSRTLVSTVSPVVNLVAGGIRYRPRAFLATALLGRLIWGLAYLGLGFGVGDALEAAAGFLENLTGLLVALAVLAWAAWMLTRRSARPIVPGS